MGGPALGSIPYPTHSFYFWLSITLLSYLFPRPRADLSFPARLFPFELLECSHAQIEFFDGVYYSSTVSAQLLLTSKCANGLHHILFKLPVALFIQKDCAQSFACNGNFKEASPL